MIGSLLEKLFVSVGVDLSGFSEELNRATDDVKKMSQDMKSKFESVGKSWQATGKSMMKGGAMMTAGITAPLLLFTKQAASAAVESREAFAQVESALASMGPVAGRTAEQLQEIAAGLQATSSFDDDEILQKVTANMLTFGNVTGEVFDQAQQMAVDLSARLGQDLQSSTIMLGKALNDPVKGLTALSRVGVSFTKEQEEMIKAMAKAGDVAGAQGLMLDELKNQYGGAAQAARDAAPGSDTVDAWREFQETIGEVVLNVLPPLTDILTRVLDAFNTLDPGTQTFIVGAAALAAALGPVVTVIGTLVSGIGFLIPVIAGAIPIVAGLAGGVWALAAPFAPLILAVGALVAAWYYWDEIVVIVKKVGAAVSSWYSENIKPTMDKAVKIFSWLTDMAIGSQIRLYKGVKNWLMDKLGAVFGWLKGKLEDVGGYFFDLYDKVVGNSYVPDMVERIGEEMAKLQTLMVDPAKKATESTKEAFRTLANSTENLLSRLFPVQAQIKDIMDDLAGLDAALKGKLISKETYEAGRKTLLEERSKAEMKAAQGQDIGPSISAVPIDKAMADLAGMIGELPQLATEAQIALEEFGQRLGDDIMGGIHGVLTGRTSFKDFLKKTFEGFLNDIIGGALSNLEKSAFGEGGLGGFIGNALSSFLGGGARAVGGPVLPGRAYDVGLGEKFVPGQAGRILSRNDAMRAAGGGQGGPMQLTVKVSGARGNQEIMEMVSAGVQQGIGQYNTVIGKQVDNNFARRGG